MTLYPGVTTKVQTGVAAVFEIENSNLTFGLRIFDRSSMAAKGIRTSGGEWDYGYRDGVTVLLTLDMMELCPFGAAGITDDRAAYEIKAGDKIAQFRPVPIFTDRPILIVENLPESSRNFSGFGSSGR